MSSQGQPRQDLTSWKEIAAFLQVSVRTAQKWETERGLPVRRIPGGRGRPFADIGELEAWKLGFQQEPAAPTDRGPAALPEVRPGRRWMWALPIVVVLAICLSILLASAARGKPTSFRIEGNTFIALDESDRELWRHRFDVPLAEARYQDVVAGRPWFGDLGGDGRTDALVPFRPDASIYDAPPALLCFSASGKLKWRFEPGRTAATSSERFDPPFSLQAFRVGRVGRDGRMGIVVTGSHPVYYPARVALLNGKGEMEREYWHSGGLVHIAIADLDGDGNNEILAGGTNNCEQSATLVVLDPDSFGGASVEARRKYQLLGHPLGKERARILFPRTCVNRKLDVRNWVADLRFHQGGLYVLVRESEDPGCGTIYSLDRTLKVVRAEFDDALKALHGRLHSDGQLDHPFSPDEEQELTRGVRVLTSDSSLTAGLPH